MGQVSVKLSCQREKKKKIKAEFWLNKFGQTYLVFQCEKILKKNLNIGILLQGEKDESCMLI